MTDNYLKSWKVTAKLDDLFNFSPARISGFILIVTALILKLDYRSAARIFFGIDCVIRVPTPGILKLQWLVRREYSRVASLSILGKVVAKPFSGNNNRDIIAQDIKLGRVNALHPSISSGNCIELASHLSTKNKLNKILTRRVIL